MNESEILIRKGFAMDDERIKGNGGGMYWKELLDRIRDIRSSEKAINNTVGRNGYIKKDWKLYREKLPGWQERYMEGLVKEYIDILSSDEKEASDKFWELEERIKKDEKHPGVLIEVRKSNALYDIIRFIALDVITYDDIADFSEELKQDVRDFTERRSYRYDF